MASKNDPEDVWLFAMMVALHDGHDLESAKAHASRSAEIADAALTEWNERWDKKEYDPNSEYLPGTDFSKGRTEEVYGK